MSVKLHLKLRGGKTVARNLEFIRRSLLPVSGAALRESGDRIMVVAKETVPLLTGALRDSGKVVGPVMLGNKESVVMSFGEGPSAEYAVMQHETPEPPFHHLPGRTWKYLEIPTLAEMANMPQAVARSIWQKVLSLVRPSAGE